jgi:hypothetical protein
MPTQIQLRRDQAADWTSANPILAEGEIGLELDTVKYKIGDGSTAWNSLSYGTTGAVALTQMPLSTKGSILAGNGTQAINVSVGTNGYFLKANSSTSSGLEWSSIPTINSLDDVGDVTITNIASNQLLVYSSGAWVNTSNPTIPGNLIVSGNLTVSGSTTTINTETLDIEDNIISLNSGAVNASSNAGVSVYRGGGANANVLIRWNESTDKWQFTNDGTNYTDFGAGGAQVSDDPPASAENGSLWFESDTARTFVYYNDGSSSQWVEIGASGMAASVSDSSPPSPITGQLWFNSASGGTFLRYSNAWVEVGAAPFNELMNKFDAAGDLLVGTGDNQASKLSLGANGYVLKSNGTTAIWSLDPITDAVTAKGDLIVGSAADTMVKLGIGSNGQALLANSSTASGMEWGQAGYSPDSDQTVIGTQLFN